LRAFTSKFPGNIFESGAFTSPALIAVVLAYAWRHWREPLGKLLVDSLIIVWVLSLGPVLHFGGKWLSPLPGILFWVLPFLNRALPTRFTMYAFLIIAIITSLWFAASPTHRRTKCAAAFLIVMFSLPNLKATYWTTKVDTPAFFVNGIYRHYLTREKNVLFIPDTVYSTDNMLWQAQTRMYFRTADGSIAPVPDEYRPWPIGSTLGGLTYLPDARWQLMSFLASHNVEAIVVSDHNPDLIATRAMLSPFTKEPLDIGGVELYRMVQGALTSYRDVTGVQAARRANMTRFNSLLAAAENYVLERKDPRELTPVRAMDLKLLRADWLMGPSKVPDRLAGTAFDPTPSLDTHLAYGIWLGRVGIADLGIGLVSTYAALKPVINHFGRDAGHVYFPAPEILSLDAKDETYGLLLMVFDHDGLARAAARAAGSQSKMPLESFLQDTALSLRENPHR